MLTSPFSPRDEKEALDGAVSRSHEQWERNPTVALINLCDAAERADEVLKAFQKISTLHKRNESGKA